ncbi:MAG TPA: DUF4129 domain-containing protein [Acidobacteriaceae bacterium]|nr:DUF4129 domain-containing protein [Acidobacteriaceae bacterium]
MFASPSAHGQTPSLQPADALSPDAFAARLGLLDQLVAACQAAPSAEHCRSSQVETSLQLQLPSGARTISFVWLRSVLDEAAHPPAPVASKAEKSKAGQQDDAEGLQLDTLPSIHDRLAAARQRLADERAQAMAAAPAAPDAAAARHHLAVILAGKDYHALHPNLTLRERVLEKIQDWIQNFFQAIADAGRGKHWIGVAAEIAFVLLLLVALFWFLIRLERQGRLVNASFAPGLGAASARDWQLWLDDARKAAAREAWREAVHYLYWSSISRLESSGLWPADRARTPREYLALLGAGHAQRPALLDLTRTFERTWYAGRPASEGDFRQAEQQAGQLGSRTPRAEKAGSL